MTALRVLGLDMSLAATGLSDGLTWCDTIATKASADAAYPDRARRIRYVADRVAEHLAGVDLVVMEGPAPSSRTGHVWDRAGLWWRVAMRVMARDMPLAVVPPNVRAKYATGKANSGKDAVLAAAVRRWPACPIANNNEADACVIAQMGRDWLGQPTTPMPASHRAALSGAAWPDMPTGETRT